MLLLRRSRTEQCSSAMLTTKGDPWVSRSLALRDSKPVNHSKLITVLNIQNPPEKDIQICMKEVSEALRLDVSYWGPIRSLILALIPQGTEETKRLEIRLVRPSCQTLHHIVRLIFATQLYLRTTPLPKTVWIAFPYTHS